MIKSLAPFKKIISVHWDDIIVDKRHTSAAACTNFYDSFKRNQFNTFTNTKILSQPNNYGFLNMLQILVVELQIETLLFNYNRLQIKG